MAKRQDPKPERDEDEEQRKTDLFKAILQGKTRDDKPKGKRDKADLVEHLFGGRGSSGSGRKPSGGPSGMPFDFSDPFNSKGWAKDRRVGPLRKPKKVEKPEMPTFMLMGLTPDEEHAAREAGKLAPIVVEE